MTGWARNRVDGSVEIEVEGDDEAVERMLGWLRSGPPGSAVTDVKVHPTAVSGDDDFRIHDTT